VALLQKISFTKETYNLIDPINQSQPITLYPSLYYTTHNIYSTYDMYMYEYITYAQKTINICLDTYVCVRDVYGVCVLLTLYHAHVYTHTYRYTNTHTNAHNM